MLLRECSKFRGDGGAEVFETVKGLGGHRYVSDELLNFLFTSKPEVGKFQWDGFSKVISADRAGIQ